MKSMGLQFTSVKVTFKKSLGARHNSASQGEPSSVGFQTALLACSTIHSSIQRVNWLPVALLWVFLPLVSLKERFVLFFPEPKCSKERDGNLYRVRVPIDCPWSFFLGKNISFFWSFSSFKTIIIWAIVHCVSEPGRWKIASVENKSASGENISHMEIFSPSKQLHDE